MPGVQQSGNVTPGHIAIFGAPGVIVDGGALPASTYVLASLRGANFNTTIDQPIIIPQRIAAFQITGLIICNASGQLSPAVGGFYPQAQKVGSPIVSAAQTYSPVTPADLMQATLTSFANTTRFSASNLGTIGGMIAVWFSLTTPNGSAVVADCYLVGTDLS